MNASPLVSVAMPCHNSATLLAWALASVVAQTYENWECIVVDDGSEDRPIDVVQAFDDPRIRFIRLDQNSGRARARQIALDAATGDYLAKLDADDWLYPQKLACQIDVLQRVPKVALVSSGIAIEDQDQRLVGVRARGPSAECQAVAPMSALASPPVAHAASMIRMPVAKRYRYNPRLRRSEDSDYLLQVLLEHRYCILEDVLYAYREYLSASLHETLDAYRSRMQMFWMYRRRFPISSIMRTAETAAKWAAYRAAFATGHANDLIARRTQPPGQDDVRRFSEARAQVAEVYARHFGEHVLPISQPAGIAT